MEFREGDREMLATSIASIDQNEALLESIVKEMHPDVMSAFALRVSRHPEDLRTAPSSVLRIAAIATFVAVQKAIHAHVSHELEKRSDG